MLSDGKVWRKHELHETVCAHIGITPEQREELLPSGQRRTDNGIGWALSGLNRAESVSKPARATFIVTDAGRTQLAKHPGGMTDRDLKNIPAYRDYVPAGQAARDSEALDVDTIADPLEHWISPKMPPRGRS